MDLILRNIDSQVFKSLESLIPPDQFDEPIDIIISLLRNQQIIIKNNNIIKVIILHCRNRYVL